MNCFSRISADQVKQSVLHVRAGGGLSFSASKLEGRPLDVQSLQLTAFFMEGCWESSKD